MAGSIIGDLPITVQDVLIVGGAIGSMIASSWTIISTITKGQRETRKGFYAAIDALKSDLNKKHVDNITSMAAVRTEFNNDFVRRSELQDLKQEIREDFRGLRDEIRSMKASGPRTSGG